MKINDKYLIRDIENETRVLKETLKRLQLSGTGETISEYEEALSKFFGVKKALAVSSGSAALHTALYCLGVRKNDEVLIPATAPIPTALPILTANARPIVVDIEQRGFGFDLSDLKKKTTPKTKAAILIPLWGYPIDYRLSLDFLNRNNIPLIEDTAQAHGTKIGDRHVGTFGKVGCFSTHDRKLIATGEGGFILTNDTGFYEKMKQFSQLGYMDGKTYGVNYKLSALQATLGQYRLNRVYFQIEKRAKYVKKILNEIGQTKITPLPIVKNGIPNYYALVLILPWDKRKNLLFIKKLDKKGIPSDILKYHFTTIYSHPLIPKYGSECVNAEFLIEHMTTIPVHPGLKNSEINYIAKTIRETYQEINAK